MMLVGSHLMAAHAATVSGFVRAALRSACFSPGEAPSCCSDFDFDDDVIEESLFLMDWMVETLATLSALSLEDMVDDVVVLFLVL
jgi:hypothetical protein